MPWKNMKGSEVHHVKFGRTWHYLIVIEHHNNIQWQAIPSHCGACVGSNLQQIEITKMIQGDGNIELAVR